MKPERGSKTPEVKMNAGHVDASLQDDVTAFASQLGLASGSQNGFNDSDFRSDIANQHIGKKGDLPYFLHFTDSELWAPNETQSFTLRCESILTEVVLCNTRMCS